MSAYTKARTTIEWTDIRVSVPASQAVKARKAITGVFDLAGVRVRLGIARPTNKNWFQPTRFSRNPRPGGCCAGYGRAKT